MIVNWKVHVGGVVGTIRVGVVRGARIRKRIVTPPAIVWGPKWRRTGREEDTLLIARHVILCLAVVICLTIFLRGYNKQHNAFRQDVQLFLFGVWCGLACFVPFILLLRHLSCFSSFTRFFLRHFNARFGLRSWTTEERAIDICFTFSCA